jgi:ketosteroid isomerase-like protein
MGSADVLDVIARFNAAFDARDVDAVMALMTDDCAFETTAPGPDGVRHEGAQAVRAAWELFFASTPTTTFTVEDAFGAGDRAVQRCWFDWGTGHVRGVDVFRVRDGRVAEKLSYVKG